VTVLYIENRSSTSPHAFTYRQNNGHWTFVTIEPLSTVEIETTRAGEIAAHHRYFGARHKDDLDAFAAPLIYCMSKQ
jgi:hypothetical protein